MRTIKKTILALSLITILFMGVYAQGMGQPGTAYPGQPGTQAVPAGNTTPSYPTGIPSPSGNPGTINYPNGNNTSPVAPGVPGNTGPQNAPGTLPNTGTFPNGPTGPTGKN